MPRMIQPYLTTETGRRVDKPLTGAGNGARTRDPKLGKLVLYQLSYTRMSTLRKSNILNNERDIVNNHQYTR